MTLSSLAGRRGRMCLGCPRLGFGVTTGVFSSKLVAVGFREFFGALLTAVTFSPLSVEATELGALFTFWG